MVELSKINELESLFSQMNGNMASQFSDLIKNTIIDTLNVGKNEKEINYNNLYKEYRDSFEIWIRPKFSHNYKISVMNSVCKIFKDDVNTIIDIKKVISSGKLTPSSASKGFRVFLNYLEENDLISDLELLRARKKIKIITSNNIDKYVPRTKEIKQTLSILGSFEFPKELLVMYKFMLESGCRFTELEYLMETFDKKNVEKFDNVITYKNFYLRGSKSSYYLFSSKETFNDLIEVMKNNELEILKYFQRKIQRTKYLVSLKYLRKYNFTKLIESEIEIEFSNFIQGRASKNIGFTNYLAKQRLSIPKYSKFINNLYLEFN